MVKRLLRLAKPKRHVGYSDATIRFGISLTASVRSGLTMQHIQSADYFARQALMIETTSQEQGVKVGDGNYDTLSVQHQAYVIGAIFAAVAFLEAAINDIFALTVDPIFEGSDYKNTLVESFDPLIRQRFADAWRGKGLWQWTGRKLHKEAGVLTKYEAAFSLADISLSRAENGGNSPYDNVRCVIDSRNYLMHNVPSTTTLVTESSLRTDSQQAADLVEKLEAKKIKRNSLGGREPTAFPARYLSAHCAAWAVQSSILFAQFFYDKMGIETPFKWQLQAVLDKYKASAASPKGNTS